MYGASHSTYGALSIEHSKVASISLALKLKVTVVCVVGFSGSGSRMNVSGATATVQMYSAGVSSWTPYVFWATTWKVCSPSIRPLYDFCEEQTVNSPVL